MREPRTPEQIVDTITAARDSVWVVDDSLAKIIASGHTNELKGNIERNVGHLRIITTDQEITESANDISDLYQAITDGQAALDAWPVA